MRVLDTSTSYGFAVLSVVPCQTKHQWFLHQEAQLWTNTFRMKLASFPAEQLWENTSIFKFKGRSSHYNIIGITCTITMFWNFIVLLQQWKIDIEHQKQFKVEGPKTRYHTHFNIDKGINATCAKYRWIALVIYLPIIKLITLV